MLIGGYVRLQLLPSSLNYHAIIPARQFPLYGPSSQPVTSSKSFQGLLVVPLVFSSVGGYRASPQGVLEVHHLDQLHLWCPCVLHCRRTVLCYWERELADLTVNDFNEEEIEARAPCFSVLPTASYACLSFICPASVILALLDIYLPMWEDGMRLKNETRNAKNRWAPVKW